jgi:hypothetical protein
MFYETPWGFPSKPAKLEELVVSSRMALSTCADYAHFSETQAGRPQLMLNLATFGKVSADCA